MCITPYDDRVWGGQGRIEDPVHLQVEALIEEIRAEGEQGDDHVGPKLEDDLVAKYLEEMDIRYCRAYMRITYRVLTVLEILLFTLGYTDLCMVLCVVTSLLYAGVRIQRG